MAHEMLRPQESGTCEELLAMAATPGCLRLPDWQSVADTSTGNDVVSRSAPACNNLSSKPSISIDRMSPSLDALSLEFLIHARSAAGWLLDVGCGDGLATAEALTRGGKVIAVDSNPIFLQRLTQRIPAEQHLRLRVQSSSLPNMDFKVGGLAAVHAAHVLHFLDGDAVESSLRKFFRWLYPRGKLFLSVLTPLGKFWEFFWADFILRSTAGGRWPGYIDASSVYYGAHNGLPSAVHLFNEQILRRELLAAGFQLERASYYPLPWDNQQVGCAIIARCSGTR